MTGPMALFSFISWIRNPFSEKSSEVKVNTITDVTRHSEEKTFKIGICNYISDASLNQIVEKNGGEPAAAEAPAAE